MVLYIRITGQQAKTRAVLYEKIGRQGKRALVPTYQAKMWNDHRPDNHFHFAVTRDAAQVVFGHTKGRFGTGGECPPCRTDSPYHGVLVLAERNGYALMLYDAESADKTTLKGQEFDERKFIMLHRGPASSLACMTIAGGKRGFVNWMFALEDLRKGAHKILVSVEPRPQADHDIHLSR